MKVLLLSRYDSMGASSRVRYLQFLNYFSDHSVITEVAPLLSNNYLDSLYQGKSNFNEVLVGCSKRIKSILRAKRYDVLIVEKELFPFFPSIVERFLSYLDIPYIADYDDAWFHRYDQHKNPLVRFMLGQKIDMVMRHAAVVVTGNQYLAERAQKSGAKTVEIIPTVVDTDRYKPSGMRTNRVFTIGWIGSPKTSHYLLPLIPIFRQLQETLPVRIVAVGARAQDFVGTPVETWLWSEETEIESIQQFDVGIMPLYDTPWERGKCGYKLIQCLACGIPVVASPVGVNMDIVKHGQNGFLAHTLDEWKNYLERLICMNLSQRQAMGIVGRAVIEQNYSLRIQAPRLLSVLQRVAKRVSNQT